MPEADSGLLIWYILDVVPDKKENKQEKDYEHYSISGSKLRK